MKLKCIVCGREYELYELFCLRSLRGANSNCIKNKCPVVCMGCLRRICDVCRSLGTHTAPIGDLITALRNVVETEEKIVRELAEGLRSLYQ